MPLLKLLFLIWLLGPIALFCLAWRQYWPRSWLWRAYVLLAAVELALGVTILLEWWWP